MLLLATQHDVAGRPLDFTCIYVNSEAARLLGRGQRRRNARIARVRPMLLPIHQVLMNAGMKCFLHLAG